MTDTAETSTCRAVLYSYLAKNQLFWDLITGCTIECFRSHDQHLCKFIETKESLCIRKEFNSQRIGLGHQHGRRFIVLGHQYGRRDVMWKHSTGWLLYYRCLLNPFAPEPPITTHEDPCMSLLPLVTSSVFTIKDNFVH